MPEVPLSVNDQAHLGRTSLVGAAAQAFRVAGVAVPRTSCHGVP